MLTYCCVQGCKSTTYKKQEEEYKNKLQFFGFPTNPVVRETWIKALLASGQSKQHVAQIKKYSRICNLHFEKHCIEKNGFSHARLKPNSMPTIFSNTSTTSVKAENIEPINAPLTNIKIEHEETSNKILSEKRMSYVGDIKKGCSHAKLKPNAVPTIFSNTPTTNVKAENIEPISAPLENIKIEHEETSNKILSTKRMSYVGDIKIENVKSMSPQTITKSITILKKAYEEKNKVIKRLRVQLFRQKRKIESLETLLCELRSKDLSPTAIRNYHKSDRIYSIRNGNYCTYPRWTCDKHL